MFRALLAVLFLLSGCDGSVRREGAPQLEFQLVRVDPTYNRRWVLEVDALAVYDSLNGRRLRRVVLPDWALAGPRDACAPDMVLDRTGAAYVSSNVQPVLWRVDPRRFTLTRIDLALDAHADKDIGFTALKLAGDGVLLANGTTVASQWSIDLRGARATLVGQQAGERPCTLDG
jgi:hypothetical protein